MSPWNAQATKDSHRGRRIGRRNDRAQGERNWLGQLAQDQVHHDGDRGGGHQHQANGE
jgi:hypothetical protein